MRTISQVVEEVIDRSPFLKEVLSEGIANQAKIARKIHGAVQDRLLEDVSESAIIMALHRLAKRKRKSKFGTQFLKQLNDVTLRSNLVEFIFSNPSDTADLWAAISKISKKRGTFINFSRGLHESLLIINSDSEKEILPVLKSQKRMRKIEGLSALTLQLPEASLPVPGVYYPILKALAENGLSFTELMSVGTEFSILLKDKDIDRAFSVIKKITS